MITHTKTKKLVTNGIKHKTTIKALDSIHEKKKIPKGHLLGKELVPQIVNIPFMVIRYHREEEVLLSLI